MSDPHIDSKELPPRIAALLRELYEPQTAESWLRASNPRLGGGRSPLDSLALGREAEVEAALRDERAGGLT